LLFFRNQDISDAAFDFSDQIINGTLDERRVVVKQMPKAVSCGGPAGGGGCGFVCLSLCFCAMDEERSLIVEKIGIFTKQQIYV